MSTSEMLQARSFRAITGPELFPPSSTGSRLGRDVVVDTKEIRWIVFVLDGGQARKVVAEGTINDLFGFDVERRQKMRVRREGPEHFFTRAGPIPLDARLVRIGPLRHGQNVPRKISIWKSGGVVGN